MSAQQECREREGLYDNTRRDKYLTITYFLDTYFSRFQNFREIKVPRKKVAGTIKDTKFSTLLEKALYVSVVLVLALALPKNIADQITRMIQHAPTGRLSTIACLKFTKFSAL